MNTDTKELATVEPLPVAPNPLTILQGAIEKGIDAEQLSQLMDLQERYEANQARRAFAAAMADFQSVCPQIRKTGKESRGRYTYPKLDEIMKTIQPHMKDCGLSVHFDTEMTSELIVTATCFVTHRDGHTQSNQFAAPVDQTKSNAGNYIMNSTQQTGSARSYAKRYALMDALNLVGFDIDDDAQCLDDRAKNHEKAKAKRQPQNPATKEQLADLKDHLESGKLNVRDTEYIAANIDRLSKLDAAEILNTLKKEQSA